MADLDLSDLRSRLAAIAEELADASISVLREAVAAGETKRPDLDRRLTQARRAVEKAVNLLDS